MIVNCPACNGQSRAQGDGLYRCPHCRAVFRLEGERVALTEAPPPAAPVAPEPLPASVDRPPEQTPPVCERCGHWQATAVCPRCGAMVCTVCAAPTAPGQATCRVHAVEETAQSPENRFGAMLSGALLRPVETFAAILTDSRLLGRAVLFFIAVGMFSMACAELYRAVLPAPYNDPAGAMLSQFLETPPAEPSLVSLVATLTLAPFLLVVSLFAEGLVLHAALRIVGGGRSGIAATVKVVAYSGASLVLLAVPVIGAPLGWVASTVLTVIGAAKAHRTSYARAAAGVLLLVGLMALLLLAAYSLMSFAGGLDTDQTTTL